MKYRLVLAVVLSALSYGRVLGQGDVDLDSLDQKIKQHIQSNIPGWTYTRVEPMTGSSNVLIENWTSSNRGIRISIVPYKSAKAAHDVLLGSFLKYRKHEEVKGLGNEAYAYGWQGSRLVLRQGRYLVYLSAGYDSDGDPELRNLDQTEKQQRLIQEIKRINQEFAKHMVTAID